MSLKLRARLTYIALFAAIGAALPYLPLYYQHVGLDFGSIGVIVATGSVASVVAGPLWGLLSDRSGGSPWVFVAAVVTALAGDGVLWLAGGLGAAFGAVLVGVALFAGAVAGVSPMLDARALELAGPDRAGYGPQRAWGSLSFVVASFATGAAVDRFGIEASLELLAVTLIATGFLAAGLGRSQVAAAHRTVIATPGATDRSMALRTLATPALGTFLGGAYLAFTTLAGLNSFMSLRYAELGAPAIVIGSSWAVGAAVEVPVMLGFPWLARRFGAERLMVAGILIFSLRAVGSALTDQPGVLIAMTGLGGLGFGCFVVGGVTYVSRHAPGRLAATAQSLFNGFANNLGQVTAGALGGRLAEGIGLAGLFGASAVLGVVASVVVAVAVRIGGRAASPASRQAPPASG